MKIRKYTAMNISHPELVRRLSKSGYEISDHLTPADCVLIHMIIGITGEVGELVDTLKRYLIYQQPLDLPNVVEELGDLEFFLEGLRQELGLTREQCHGFTILRPRSIQPTLAVLTRLSRSREVNRTRHHDI